MSDSSQQDVMQILKAATVGRRTAVDRLLMIVYDELHAMAERCLRHECADHTLGPTALVHEVYLRLVDQTQVQWKNRAHFMGVAAQAARRILTDHARAQMCEKRGKGGCRTPLSAVGEPLSHQDLDLLALDEALEQLRKAEPIGARIVEMRFFGGMSIREIAEVLGVSDRTVRRRWRYAKTWLYREVRKGDTRTENGGDV